MSNKNLILTTAFAISSAVGGVANVTASNSNEFQSQSQTQVEQAPITSAYEAAHMLQRMQMRLDALTTAIKIEKNETIDEANINARVLAEARKLSSHYDLNKLEELAKELAQPIYDIQPRLNIIEKSPGRELSFTHNGESYTVHGVPNSPDFLIHYHYNGKDYVSRINPNNGLIRVSRNFAVTATPAELQPIHEDIMVGMTDLNMAVEQKFERQGRSTFTPLGHDKARGWRVHIFKPIEIDRLEGINVSTGHSLDFEGENVVDGKTYPSIEDQVAAVNLWTAMELDRLFRQEYELRQKAQQQPNP